MARWLCIDHGQKVLGVAVSDALGVLARPLKTIRRRSKAEDFAEVARLIADYDAAGIVVGLPLNPTVPHSKHVASVRRWAQRMAAAVQVPVWLWDESFSSEEAAQLVAGRREPGARIDDAAAAVILQSFLEARREDPQAGEQIAV